MGEKDATTIAALKRAVELYERWKKPNLAAKYRVGLLSASSPAR
jgi:hypothetical protein